MATSPLNSYEIFLTFILWVFDFDLNTQYLPIYMKERKVERQNMYVCMLYMEERKFCIYLYINTCIYTMNICVCVYIR